MNNSPTTLKFFDTGEPPDQVWFEIWMDLALERFLVERELT